MKVLIIGSTGMLGSMCYDYLHSRNIKVIGYSRTSSPRSQITGDVFELNWEELILYHNVTAVVNCIGMLNNALDQSFKEFLLINTTLPNMFMSIAKRTSVHFIHVSTDCVFSGKKGPYSINDKADALDKYGLSKSFGEAIIDGSNTTVIRTSIIGPEIQRSKNSGLLHWAISQRDNRIEGYSEVFWNGVTTLELSKVIERIFLKGFTGMTQVACDRCISKLELLTIINKIFGLGLIIKSSSRQVSNKCLINSGEFLVADITTQIKNLYDFERQF